MARGPQGQGQAAMAEAAPLHIWLHRLAYVAISGAVIFFYLLPQQTTPSRWAAPDLLSCLTYAWVLRRPDYVPALLIGAVMLLADMLFERPPGLQAALVVMGAEFLRQRQRFLRKLPFWFEWALVAGVMVAVMIAGRLALAIVMVERPSLGLTLLQLLATLLAYPLVVFVSRHVFDVHKLAPGEVDALGHRL